MPRTQGQALLNFAIMDRNERDRLESQYRKQQRKLKKRGRRAGFFGGLGKLVGGVAGNLIAPGVGGAIGASLLGRLGGEVGKKSVGGGRAKVGRGFLLNRMAAKDINRGLRSQEQDFERGRQGGMLSDAAFGYSMGKGFNDLFRSAKGALKNDPMQALKTLMGQTQGQGLAQVGQVAQMPGTNILQQSAQNLLGAGQQSALQGNNLLQSTFGNMPQSGNWQAPWQQPSTTLNWLMRGN